MAFVPGEEMVVAFDGFLERLPAGGRFSRVVHLFPPFRKRPPLDAVALKVPSGFLYRKEMVFPRH
jgi:hypothetical protein